jgi:transposase
VRASGTTLTDIFGVGPFVAGMLIGYTGDPLRFATPARFAAYTGSAPVEFSPAAGSCTDCHGEGTGTSTTRYS